MAGGAHRACCCNECCSNGRYGYLHVELVSGAPGSKGATYRLLNPPSISGRVLFFCDEPELSPGSLTPTDAYVEIGALTDVGEAVLCSMEPTEPGGNIYHALWWRGEIAGLYVADYEGGLFGTVDNVAESVSEATTGTLTVTGSSILLRGNVSGELGVGEIPPSYSLEFDVSAVWKPETGFVVGDARVFHRLVETTISNWPGGGDLTQQRCLTFELRGCMNIANIPDDSTPWEFAYDAPALPARVRAETFFASAISPSPLPDCPSDSFFVLPFRSFTAQTALTLQNLAITGAPVLCGDAQVFSGADCETEDGPCVIGGIVRDPICCIDKTAEACNDNEMGPCCDGVDPSTPSNFVFVPSTYQRVNLFWAIYQFRLDGSKSDLWFGGFYGDLPAPGAQSDCRISRVGQNGPVPGFSAFHVVYPPGGGTPSAFGNTYSAQFDLGEDAALPSRAGFFLNVTGESNNNVAQIAVRQPANPLDPIVQTVSGVQGVSNTQNTVRTPRFFRAEPYNGSLPFWIGVNYYLQTIGNPAATHRWRTNVLIESYARNYAPCPLPSPLLMIHPSLQGAALAKNIERAAAAVDSLVSSRIARQRRCCTKKGRKE